MSGSSKHGSSSRHGDSTSPASSGSSSASHPSGGGKPKFKDFSSPKLEDRLRDENPFRKMSYAELKAATGGFDRANLLGSGGFGDVYRGKGPKGQDWAVKRARQGTVHGSGTAQGQKDFEREVVTMSQLSHKHLVKLLGYCTDKGEHIVVYELMENGSLAKVLHGQDSGAKSSACASCSSSACSESSDRATARPLRGNIMSASSSFGQLSLKFGFKVGLAKSGRSHNVEPCCDDPGSGNGAVEGGVDQTSSLSFLQRVDIAAGTAEALRYLHTALAAPVVHRDVKPDNILLDGKMRPKVADFGLVKLIKDTDKSPGQFSQMAESTRVTGTRGYLDPDYWEEGKASPAVDVYSFGVVMLELLTGRRALVTGQSDLKAMHESNGTSQGSSKYGTSSSSLEELEMQDGSNGGSFGGDAPLIQQASIREWVEHILRTKRSLHAILDPRMDLDIGMSSRKRRSQREEGGIERDDGCSTSGDDEAQRRKKSEAVEKALKDFLQLALKCTLSKTSSVLKKTSRRPSMSEVATQLEQIKKDLRAARDSS